MEQLCNLGVGERFLKWDTKVLTKRKRSQTIIRLVISVHQNSGQKTEKPLYKENIQMANKYLKNV